MTKKIGLSVAAAALLASTNVSAAENLSEAFTNAKMNGKAQLFYQTREGKDVSLTDQDMADATAGLQIGLVTEEYNGVQIGMTYDYLHTLGLEHNMVSGVVNTPAGGANNDEASTLNGGYFSEFYLQKTAGNTIVKVGNQKINTPMVNSDGWAVAPNTFGAGVVMNKDIEGVTIVAAHVATEKTRMSGNYGTFYQNGADAFGAVINSIDKMPIQVWYYNAEQIATAMYADVKADMGGLKVAAQFGNVTPSDHSNSPATGGDATTALGLKVSADVGVNVSLAASQVSDGAMRFTNLGDGGTKTPLFTQMTIAGDGDIVGETDTTAIAAAAKKKIGSTAYSAHFSTASHGKKASTVASREETSTSMEVRAVTGWSENTKTFLAFGNYNHHRGFFAGEADTANNFLRFWMKHTF